MTIEEKIRQIMLSEELPDTEKLDQIARPHPGSMCAKSIT
jgi:hypothetical protein